MTATGLRGTGPVTCNRSVGAESLAEGLARGKAESLVVMLDARGVALGAAERARILGERDPATLARWLTRAATCTNLAEVFAEA